MWRWAWERDRKERVLIVTLLYVAILGGGATTSGAAERRPAAVASSQPQRLQPQERLLQRFISSSLAEKTAEENGVEALRSLQPPASPEHTSSAEHLPGSLTTAATKMVLSLGAVLSVLIVGGYLVRRYLFQHTFLGKRNNLLRVLARINIAPKIGAALLEVPGKALVIGITGSTITVLSEVDREALMNHDTVSDLMSASFESALDQDTPTAKRESRTDEALLRASEAMQQKVRQLKQL